MQIDSSIKNLWKKLDQMENPHSERDISREIGSFIKTHFGENSPDILLWEKFAFDFVEDYPADKSNWNTYFGPKMVKANEEGKLLEYPSIHLLTPDILSYWGKRAQESKNPILKARYANLVLDFSEKIKGKRAHHRFAQIFIDSVIEISRKNLHTFNTKMIKKFKRALNIALAYNDKERIKKLIDAITAYEEKIAEDDKPGLWGFSYELLVKNKKVPLSKPKENRIVEDLERRFDRLIKNNDYWSARHATILLADYYSRRGDKEKTKAILRKLYKLLQRQIDSNQLLPMTATMHLNELYALYSQYGITDGREQILNKIRELSGKLYDSLIKVAASVEIGSTEFQKYIEQLIDGDFNMMLQRITIHFLPFKEQVLKQIEELSKKAPISFLATGKIMDDEGRIVATVGPLEKDPTGNLIFHIAQDLSISAPFLREALKAFLNKFNPTAHDLVNYLYKSPIFREDRKEFFIRGLDAYLKGDFVASLHILIPQFEAIIRNLAQIIEVPVIKPSPSGGYFYRTLDELLREDRIVNVLSEDLSLYLRTLLTDPRGWNIRNNLCHGISNFDSFNAGVADRVFHALLNLSLARKKNSQ